METTSNPFNVLEFKYKLAPILEMLTDKEKNMSREDWVDLVNLFRERIISLPEQYLSGEIPSGDVLSETVDLVFDELEGKKLLVTEN